MFSDNLHVKNECIRLYMPYTLPYKHIRPTPCPLWRQTPLLSELSDAWSLWLSIIDEKRYILKTLWDDELTDEVTTVCTYSADGDYPHHSGHILQLHHLHIHFLKEQPSTRHCTVQMTESWLYDMRRRLHWFPSLFSIFLNNFRGCRTTLTRYTWINC